MGSNVTMILFVSPTATPRNPINFYPMHYLGMKLQQFMQAVSLTRFSLSDTKMHIMRGIWP